MRFCLTDPIFRGNFVVFVGAFSEVERYLRSRNGDASNLSSPKEAKTIEFVDEKAGTMEVLLWFRPEFDPTEPLGQSTLAHEAMHAVYFVLRARGVDDSAVLNEVGNYYMEWLVLQVASRIRHRQSRVAKGAAPGPTP